MYAQQALNIHTDTASLDDLLLAHATLEILKTQYGVFNLTMPTTIPDQQSAIEHEINDRRRSEIKKRLELAKARRSALASPDEKRASLDKEITELEALAAA